MKYLVASFIFCIFAPILPFFIRGSYTDSCSIDKIAIYDKMEAINNDNNYGYNKEMGVLVEKDIDGFTWIYQGKEHGFDSWYGIPPENI